jgi:CHRD domain
MRRGQLRRLIILLAPLALGAVALANAGAGTERSASIERSGAAATRAVCHRTGSARRPYVRLRVTARQLRTHNRHPADIIPAPRRCPQTLLTPTSGGTAFTVNLVGETESPAGDPVGTGTATVRMRRGQGQVCFSLRAQNITLPSVGAHIHRGAAGANGGIVVQFRAPGQNGQSSGCTTAARSLVAQILGSPEGYYVNVHTTDFPAGAIRGQLRGDQGEAGRTFSTTLSGAQECTNAGACGVGDTDGAGTAVVRFRSDQPQVCFRITVQNIRLPSVGAHIHRGASGANGPIVVGFTAPNADGRSSGCVTADQAVIAAILAGPTGYYVNVHTTDFPGGAIRGQLPAS